MNIYNYIFQAGFQIKVDSNWTDQMQLMHLEVINRHKGDIRYIKIVLRWKHQNLSVTSHCNTSTVNMFKLIAFFAILAAAFAVPAPNPNPKPDPLSLIQPGLPLTYSQQYTPISYSNLGYNLPYAYNYNYYGAPLAYRNLYY
ncbi:hypothetical protein JTB14_014649 [Gonioctena quinquepunctata]|nr:hypothetical protein JTB14_014649 [Gonioctena quinquepunctata]